MAKANILVDSCFWIALYTPEETERHERALDLIDDLENNEILLPWPTLYEFVNTRLARRKDYLFAFEQFLLKPNVRKISDEIYKSPALENIFELNISRMSSISLIDEVLRQMILDANLKIDYLVTFNRSDFEYPCQLAKVLILE
jgi:predicted nucleic acid-binding protein